MFWMEFSTNVFFKPKTYKNRKKRWKTSEKRWLHLWSPVASAVVRH